MKKKLQLKAARVLRGLTQAELGGRIGRSQAWVCQVERGLIEPEDVDVALICRVLRIEPQSIFPGNSDFRSSDFAQQMLR